MASTGPEEDTATGPEKDEYNNLPAADFMEISAAMADYKEANPPPSENNHLLAFVSSSAPGGGNSRLKPSETPISFLENTSRHS